MNAYKIHGTRSRYAYGCRCAECRKANTKYQQVRKTEAAKGKRRTIEADAVQKHLSRLGEQGYGVRIVAQVTGLNHGHLHRIRHAKKPIQRKTADKILRVTSYECRRCLGFVPIEPTRQMVNDLLDHGYEREEIARQLGYKGRSLHFLYNNKSGKITVLTEMAVRRVYNQLMHNLDVDFDLPGLDRLRELWEGRQQQLNRESPKYHLGAGAQL
jgi:hypothetical protein